MYAAIDYGYGRAEIWGDFTPETIERVFHNYANQCFGIRKSIICFKVIDIAEINMPLPWSNLKGAATLLKHSGDVIVWNADGEKIKSEWD